MRPRPDAAENADRRNAAAGHRCASMRPRPDAAENVGAPAGVQGPPLASMRPRPDAAENLDSSPDVEMPYYASMRPRPDAAENAWVQRRRGERPSSFNEAAARCRGKPEPRHAVVVDMALLQ